MNCAKLALRQTFRNVATAQVVNVCICRFTDMTTGVTTIRGAAGGGGAVSFCPGVPHGETEEIHELKLIWFRF